ncbi:unnamed protein product [Durusdinium trenchii]|uniref:Uncharacterized protein n=1 Tax=Durusdinium trenchii TaxID=1381693 RepID=A0ABP0N2N7_9DINO
MAQLLELWRRIAADEVEHAEFAARVAEVLAILEDPESELQAAALGCLAAISARDPAACEGAQLQVVQVLLQSSPALLSSGALCVEAMAVDARSREVFRRCGAVKALVAALARLAPSSLPDGALPAVLAALKSLSVDEACQAEMAQLGALELLVQRLETVKAAECLGHFALQEVYRNRLYDLGAVIQLLKFIDSEHPSPSVGAVAALFNLCAHRACKVAVCQKGGLRLLSNLLSASSPLNQVAAMTFASLAEEETCAEAMADWAESQCLPALVQCLASRDEILLEKASQALLAVAQTPNGRRALCQEENLQQLLAPLRPRAKGAEGAACASLAKRLALSLMQRLAEEPAGRRALRRGGVVTLLRPWLEPSLSTEEAARLAWNLCAEEGCALELCRTGGVRVLLAAAESQCTAAVGALLLLSSQEEAMRQLYEQDAVLKLLPLLETRGELAILSAKLVTRMALELEQFPQDVWLPAAGALGEHLRSGSCAGQLAEELGACCWVLCGDQARCAVFVEHDGLWALAKLLAEEEALEPAVGCLQLLCHGHPKRQDAFLEAVCALLEDEELRRRRLCDLGVYDEWVAILSTLGT